MSEKIIEVNTAAEMYEMLTAADRAWVDEVLKKAHAKLCKVRERSAKKLPSEAQNGVHDNKLETKGNIGIARGFWTNGFWAGMLWQMYAETGDERYKEIARFTLPILDECLLEMDTHDIGFLWLPTAVLDYKITGDEGAKNSALAAAKWLAGRFNPAPNIIRAWGSGDEKMALSKVDPPMRLAGVTIIDCMMNLPLLYWASNETGDPRYRNIAMRHADMAMQYFVREDGSVIHINEFDPDTGAYVDNFGGQGYGKGSAWSRGQGSGLTAAPRRAAVRAGACAALPTATRPPARKNIWKRPKRSPPMCCPTSRRMDLSPRISASRRSRGCRMISRPVCLPPRSSIWPSWCRSKRTPTLALRSRCCTPSTRKAPIGARTPTQSRCTVRRATICRGATLTSSMLTITTSRLSAS